MPRIPLDRSSPVNLGKRNTAQVKPTVPTNDCRPSKHQREQLLGCFVVAEGSIEGLPTGTTISRQCGSKRRR